MQSYLTRKQRRAPQAQLRRDKTTGSLKNIDSKTRNQTLKAFSIVKRNSPTKLATQPNLYSRCVEGVSLFQVLRKRPLVKSEESYNFSSLAGQQAATLFSEATLDNVLTILVGETYDRKWSWSIIVDNGLIFSSPQTEPCASREEAERGASAGLAMIGRSAEPAPEYVPEAEPDKKLWIRVNGTGYVVRKVSDNPKFLEILREAMSIEGMTYDGLLAKFANLVLRDGADKHPVALTTLANCDWTHVTQEIAENFCAANGIDDLCGSEYLQESDGDIPLIH